MSVDALSGYDSEFNSQLSSASSEFTELAVIGGVKYYGIFDEHAEIFSQDQGGITPSQTAPRFWLSEKPAGFVKRITVTIRGKDYEGIRIDPDKNGAYLIILSVK